ncbi:MAG TPA: hydroxyacid dehydrogenase [Actinospica sp.]|jgi:phosphoglycerate dehydrogenase-like enzyme|nr:hydroxyacid dehydrogenase [Actinospica sp.]
MPEPPRVLVVLDPAVPFADLFDADACSRVERVARWKTPGSAYGADALPADELAETDVILAGWGMPVLDEDFLRRAPRLRAVLYAAGSVKRFVTDAAWARGVQVSSAAWANALPVAEYALAAILLAGKDAFGLREHYRSRRSEEGLRSDFRHVGNYRGTVGIVGASMIGRRVLRLLREHDLERLVYDPFLSELEAAELGARKVELDELCARSDIVSVHAPELPETRHMLDARRLALVRDGATVINTARGSLIDTDALTEQLAAGRLNAILDVVEPMPSPDSPLFTLPNVFLTPHVAGSFGNELRRLGDSAVAELERYAAGRALVHVVSRRELARSA